MNDIKNLLSRFGNILDKSSVEKDVVVKVFERILNIKIKREDVSFKNDKLFIKSDSYLKTEIKINKESLLKEIKKQGIEKVIKDIN
ncbi:MAG: hypothetical protein R3B55_00600 [Candidatus Paceibacterota bacterium]